VLGDLKQMSQEWLVGASFQGYGCTLIVGVGVPIPLLNEEIAQYTAVKDEDIYTQIVDYSKDYPEGGPVQSLGEVNYKQLKSGKIKFNGREIPTTPLSSYPKAKQIAEILKEWIQKGEFLLGEPQQLLPSVNPL
jgi:uncharacterized protein (DUF39 family)